MAGRESAARLGVLHELEILEVGAACELVMSVHVAVVHEHPGILVDELEHAGTFDCFGRLLQCAATLVPGRGFSAVFRG